VFDLPADLFIHRFGLVRIGKPNSFDSIGGGTQSVGTHMGYADSLTRGSGCSHCRWRFCFYFVGADIATKPAANLFGST
jgi:hypothetical protein